MLRTRAAATATGAERKCRARNTTAVPPCDLARPPRGAQATETIALPLRATGVEWATKNGLLQCFPLRRPYPVQAVEAISVVIGEGFGDPAPAGEGEQALPALHGEWPLLHASDGRLGVPEAVEHGLWLAIGSAQGVVEVGRWFGATGVEVSRLLRNPDDVAALAVALDFVDQLPQCRVAPDPEIAL